MNHPDLDDLELRANRMSDGMVVNRDKFAREVRALIREVRNWRNAHERAPSHTENPHAGWYADADTINHIFTNMKKGSKK